MSTDLSIIERRALALDEARKIRLLKAEEIDTAKYLKANDITHQVHEASTWLDEIHEELSNPAKKEVGALMPWPKTHNAFRFRPGEVTLYAGSNGGGKSLITGQVALGLVKQRQSICVASFEMKPKRTLFRMLRQFAGENIDVPRFSDKAKYLDGILSRFRGFSDGRLFLYDQQGTTSSQQVIAMARYCATELNIQHVFIDSLMKCVSGEDDYNAQKYFVDELTAVARDHNIHIHLIHHIRKLQSEEIQPNKNDIKGTGAIADQVDNVLLMWRNKKKEHKLQMGATVSENDPDAMLMCEKQRNGESEDWFNLWYDRDSQQFVEMPEAVAMAFDHGGVF
jgi:twinkle protein